MDLHENLSSYELSVCEKNYCIYFDFNRELNIASHKNLKSNFLDDKNRKKLNIIILTVINYIN